MKFSLIVFALCFTISATSFDNLLKLIGTNIDSTLENKIKSQTYSDMGGLKSYNLDSYKGILYKVDLNANAYPLSDKASLNAVRQIERKLTAHCGNSGLTTKNENMIKRVWVHNGNEFNFWYRLRWKETEKDFESNRVDFIELQITNKEIFNKSWKVTRKPGQRRVIKKIEVKGARTEQDFNVTLYHLGPVFRKVYKEYINKKDSAQIGALQLKMDVLYTGKILNVEVVSSDYDSTLSQLIVNELKTKKFRAIKTVNDTSTYTKSIYLNKL